RRLRPGDLLAALPHWGAIPIAAWAQLSVGCPGSVPRPLRAPASLVPRVRVRLILCAIAAQYCARLPEIQSILILETWPTSNRHPGQNFQHFQTGFLRGIRRIVPLPTQRARRMRNIPLPSASEGESGRAGFHDGTESYVQLGAQSGRILSGTTLSGQSELFR